MKLTIHNHAKAKLEAGELAIGVGLRQARTVDVARIMKTAGFDWLFIDMEHNAMGIDVATQIAVAAQDAGVTPLIRVPGHEHHHATRALDCGAQGVVFPHVGGGDAAARIASDCRYPPEGKRSMAGLQPQLAFEAHPTADAAAAVNASLLIVAMIESPTGLDAAEAIAATPGIDAILIGTNDLCMEMGIPGQFDHPKVDEAFQRVGAACKAHGKHLGMGGIYDPALMKKHIDGGVRLILSGSDLAFMMAAGAARARDVRALL